MMQTYLDKGYAEALTERREVEDSKSWLLPHHPVLNPNMPGKLRIVFDCDTLFMGTSLNQSLMQGPDLVNSLVGVLLRFRLEPVALVSDIEAMFHQAKVRPEDRSSLKFLW